MKTILVGAFFTLITSSCFSQIYIRASAGYNLSMGQDQITSEENTFTRESKGIYGSLGSGFSAHFAVGSSFNNSIVGYELDAGYLAGRKFNSASSSPFGNNQVIYFNESYYARAFQINPSITFTAATGKVRPFARMGPVISIGKVTSEQSLRVSSDIIAREDKLSGGIGFGFKAASGVNFILTENLSLFAEVNFISLSYAPTKGEVQRLTFNGENRINTLEPSEVNYMFEKEFTSSENLSDNNTSLKDHLPMGSIGLQFGVKYAL